MGQQQLVIVEAARGGVDQALGKRLESRMLLTTGLSNGWRRVEPPLESEIELEMFLL